jgi:hypothetical protein
MARLTWRVPIGLAVKDSNIASRFGSRVAEAPILDRMREDAALGKPGDFGLYADKGNNDSDPEMFVFIGLRNNLPTARITEMKNYRASLAAGQWSRPDALCHTVTAREYYEIKPESAPGISGGEDKFPNIDRFMTRFGLPYRRGNSYLRGGVTDEAPLLDNNGSFQAEMQALQTMLNLRKVRLFIQWDRPQDGLIVYRAKVTVDTDDPHPENLPMQELAVCVLKLGIQAAIPGTLLGASATSALTAVLLRIRQQLDQLKRNLDTEMGLHKSLLKQATPSAVQTATAVAGVLNPALLIPGVVNVLVNPALRPVVGAGVQMLNPAKHTLEIWKPVQEALAAGEAALQARNAVKALAQLAVGQAAFVKAVEQLKAFRNGTELAARRAQVVIGVTAAVAIVAAVVVFSATGAAAAGGVVAGDVAAGSTQPQVRVAAQFFRVGMEEIALANSPEAFDAGAQKCMEDAPRALMKMVLPPPAP